MAEGREGVSEAENHRSHAAKALHDTVLKRYRVAQGWVARGEPRRVCSRPVPARATERIAVGRSDEGTFVAREVVVAIIFKRTGTAPGSSSVGSWSAHGLPHVVLRTEAPKTTPYRVPRIRADPHTFNSSHS